MIFLIVLLSILILYWLFMSPSSQIFGNFPSKIKTTKKTVYLTFDDGPNEPYTSQIVDFLNSKKIKATFFVVGDCAKKNAEVLIKMTKSGHTIGNHTKSHSFLKYFLTPDMKQEILDNQKIIEKITGKKPTLFRPPWLMHYPILLRSIKKLGLKPISGVFCHPLEIFQIDAQKIAKGATKKARPGQIIIFHDGYNAKGANRAQTVQAVKLTVEELTKQGYSFQVIPEK